MDEKLSILSAAGMALKSKAAAFESLAKRILEKCHEKSEIRAKFLLLEEIATLGPSSCLQLAIHGNCQEFVSDEACQQLFEGISLGSQFIQDQFLLSFIYILYFPTLSNA